MEGAGRSPVKPESLPPSSLINKLSSVFGRDWSTTPAAPAKTAVLTSFRTLSKEDATAGECKQSSADANANDGLKGREDAPLAGSSDRRKDVRSVVSTKVPIDPDHSVDSDLLLVTMVETYSDTENDDGDEEETHTAAAPSGELSWTPETPASEEVAGQTERPREPPPYSSEECRYIEQNVDYPVFRTHNLLEHALKNPSALHHTRFTTTNSKMGKDEAHDDAPGSATTNGPVNAGAAACEAVAISCSGTGVVTDPLNVSAGGISSTEPSADESVKSAEAPVDCSPKASLITPVEEREKAEDVDQVKEISRQKDKDVKGREESHPIPVSPRLPLSSPRITGVSLGPSPRPAAKSDTNDKTEELLGSLGRIEATGVSSASPRITQGHTKTKVGSTNTSPKTPSSSLPASTDSSPSKGAATSPAGPFQLPALFRGLRVLKKGATGEDRETLSEIKQREKATELAMLSLKKTVNKAKHVPEQITVTPARKRIEPKPVADTKSNFIGQLNLLLNLDNHEMSSRPDDGQESPNEAKKDAPKGGKEAMAEQNVAVVVYTSPTEKKKTSDLAYETFKNVFGPKSPKKEMTEPVDLDAVKKKIKIEKELLKSIFDRSGKSPGSPTNLRSPTEANTEVTSPTDSEEKTPGRLQAVWPPPKPKDEEDKVGLRYTEAEHQAALLQLKRECKEEVDKLHVSYHIIYTVICKKISTC